MTREGGRRRISVARVAAGVERQRRADEVNAPDVVTSLMGAIRLFAPLIDSRKAHGFTDPQIVQMLAMHGVDVTAETLRVYRSRLRREGADRAPAQIAPLGSAAPVPRRAAGVPAEPTSAPRKDEFTNRITLDDSV